MKKGYLLKSLMILIVISLITQISSGFSDLYFHNLNFSNIIMPTIYIVSYPNNVINITKIFDKLHITYIIRSDIDVSEAKNFKIILISSDLLKEKNLTRQTTSLLNIGGILLLSFGNDAGNILTKTIKKFLITNASIVIGQLNKTLITTTTSYKEYKMIDKERKIINIITKNETVKTITKDIIPELPQDTYMYGIFTIQDKRKHLPTVHVIYKGKYNEISTVNAIVNAWTIISTNMPNWIKGIQRGLTNNENIKQTNGLTYNGFTFSGAISYSSDLINNWGETVGTHQVQIQYYYTYQYSNAGTYYWFLNYIQHLITGYSGSYGINYWPDTTIEYINGETSLFPGQILFTSDPTGVSSYTLSVGTTGATASVTYTVKPQTLSYAYLGDITTGENKWTHNINNGQTNITYDAKSSTVYMLDPTKSGGYLPLITYNKFSASFYYRGSNAALLTTSAPDISFYASISTDPSRPIKYARILRISNIVQINLINFLKRLSWLS